MTEPKPFSVFLAQLAEAKRPKYNGPRDLAFDAEQFVRFARKLHAIFERQCNGYQDPAAEKRDEKAEKRLIGQILDLANTYGFDAVHIQGDPRGWPVYLGYTPHMTNANYSTHGIGVPV